jgi:hypothetical protein
MYACLLLICAFLSIPQSGKNKTITSPNDDYQIQETKTPKITSDQHSFCEQVKIEAEYQQTYNAYYDKLYRWYLVAAIVTAITSLVGLGFLYVQSKATQNAAKAAKSSAEGVINIERAWVMSKIERVPSIAPRAITENHTGVTCRIICKNDGKTPAWITDIRIGGKIVELVEQLPSEPDIMSTDVVSDCTEPLGVGTDTRHDHTVQFKGLQTSNVFVIYGVVKYRDAFNTDRKTFFGYKVTKDDKFERLSGLPKYNQNT